MCNKIKNLNDNYPIDIEKIAGIDYGSKKSGNTVICYQINGELNLLRSKKSEDADQWLHDIINSISVTHLFIDAPLSLPGIYTGNGDDYFYRKADRDLKAMSPMFIGGLTARAMKFARDMTQKGISVFESYPAAYVKEEKLKGYKSEEPLAFAKKIYPEVVLSNINSMHHVDALICWLIGRNHITNKARKAGKSQEGIIYF